MHIDTIPNRNSRPAHLLRESVRGRAWMARDFAWDGIARQMVEVNAWLLGRKPACVIID